MQGIYDAGDFPEKQIMAQYGDIGEQHAVRIMSGTNRNMRTV